MPRTRPLAVFIVIAGALCGTSLSQEAPRPTAPLAGLAGEWSVLDAQGEPTGLRARYEDLADGAAVLERMLVGTANETVTLYHRDGGLLTATRVEPGGRTTRLVPLDGGGLAFRRADADDDGGPADIVIARLADDRLRVAWTVRPEAAGRDGARVTFELRRETSLADLAVEVARARSGLERLEAELARRLKAQVTVVEDGKPRRRLLETRTFPTAPGWNVSGVPFRLHTHGQSMRFASTFASEGDAGRTVAHHPFRAGTNGRVRFSVMGGHAFVALVEETRAPPRKLDDLAAFHAALIEGTYGPIVESVQGSRNTLPVAVEWDISRFAGKSMRLYVVDVVTDHYGQVAVSEIALVEDAPE